MADSLRGSTASESSGSGSGNGAKSLHRFLNGYRGQLHKQGHVFKNWRPRYFVLEKQRLRYYAEESHVNVKLNGEYIIGPNTVIFDIPGESDGQRNLFYLSKKTDDGFSGAEDILYLSAASADEKSAWIEAIYDAVHNGFKMIEQMDLWHCGFYPKQELFVSYPQHGVVVENGNVLPIETVESAPLVVFEDSSDRFALLLLDIDAIPDATAAEASNSSNKSYSNSNNSGNGGALEIHTHCRLHWAVVDIPGNNVAAGTELTSYLSPAPAFNSGLHRYFFLLFRQCDGQPLNTAHLAESIERLVQRSFFDYRSWVQHLNMGDPVAINGFYCGWQQRCDALHEARDFAPPEAYRSPQQQAVVSALQLQQQVEVAKQELLVELSLVKDVFPALPTTTNQQQQQQQQSIGLCVEYAGGSRARDGCILAATETHSMPRVSFQPHNESDFYSLLLLDPDAPSRVNHSMREFIHWVVVNIPGNEVTKGTEVLSYLGPAPPFASGLHRYVFCLYKQSQKLPSKQIQAAMQHFSSRGGTLHSQWVQQQADFLLQQQPLGVEAFLCEWEAACDGYHAAMDWLPPKAYRSPRQNESNSDNNSNSSGGEEDAKRLQQMKAAELLFRSKLKEVAPFLETLPVLSSSSDIDVSGNNSLPAETNERLPVNRSTTANAEEEQKISSAITEQLRLQQEQQEMLREQHEKFMKEQQRQAEMQAEILRQQQRQFEQQQALLEKQQEQLLQLSRSRSLEQQDSFYGELQLSSTDEVLLTLPGSPRLNSQLRRPGSPRSQQGMPPRSLIGSHSSSFHDLRSASAASTGSPVGTLQRKPSDASMMSSSKKNAIQRSPSLRGASMQQQMNPDQQQQQSEQQPQYQSQSLPQQLYPNSPAAAVGRENDDYSRTSTITSHSGLPPAGPNSSSGKAQMLNKQHRAASVGTPNSSINNTNTAKLARKLSSNGFSDRTGSPSGKIADQFTAAASGVAASGGSNTAAGAAAATSELDFRERVAAAGSTAELCRIFKVKATSIFQGETMKKKYSKDYLAKDALIWIDAKTKSLHWAKSKGDASSSKYLLLDRFKSDSGGKPIGEMKGIIKRIDANGANLVVHIESGESLELKLSADGFPPAAERATEWVRVMRAFDAP